MNPLGPVMDWIVSPLNLYSEALTSNVTVFSDRAFKEAIKVKQGHKDEALIRHDCCSYKKRETQSSHSMHVERRNQVKTQWDYKSGRAVSPETNPGDPWSLTPNLQNYKKTNLLFKPPHLWYFVSIQAS